MSNAPQGAAARVLVAAHTRQPRDTAALRVPTQPTQTKDTHFLVFTEHLMTTYHT